MDTNQALTSWTGPIDPIHLPDNRFGVIAAVFIAKNVEANFLLRIVVGSDGRGNPFNRTAVAEGPPWK
jgi:hypothetical protein